MDGDRFLNNIWFYLIFFLFFGLFLLLITLIVEKPAVIFTLGIFNTHRSVYSAIYSNDSEYWR